jgi:CubicO group peptidase (beta-lactamase class C family)
MIKVLKLLVATTLLAATLPALANLPVSSVRMISPTRFGLDHSELTDIKIQMQAAIDSGHLPGAMLMVGNSDGVGALLTVGTEGPNDTDPVNTDTIWRIYSMTKPVISVATMMLVEEGLINLDDPVGKFIPEFANLTIIDEQSGNSRPAHNIMSVQHLLTQESGIVQAIFANGTPLGDLYRQNVSTRGKSAFEVAQSIGRLPVLFEPGTRWHYGHSTDVLGAVIEVATGQTLDELLQQRIFGPLGMDDTSFWVPASKAYRIAEPIHGQMGDNTVVQPFLSGGGGLNSTIEDYARFANMLLNGGEYHGVRIIEEDTLKLMTQKFIGDSVSREHFFYGDRGDWGLGFHLQPTTDDPDGPHNFGWRGIGGTLFLVDPENDFYLLYMEQRRGGPRGAPFSNNTAQRVVYDAMRD